MTQFILHKQQQSTRLRISVLACLEFASFDSSDSWDWLGISHICRLSTRFHKSQLTVLVGEESAKTGLP